MFNYIYFHQVGGELSTGMLGTNADPSITLSVLKKEPALHELVQNDQESEISG